MSVLTEVFKPPQNPQATTAKGFNERVQAYVTERWQDRKNAYITYHQSIWQALLMYANQTWIEWNNQRKMWEPEKQADGWVPQPRINYFSPTIDAVGSNFAAVPEVEAVARPDDDPEAIMVAQIATDLASFFIKDNALHTDYQNEEDKSGTMAQIFVLTGCIFSELTEELVDAGTKEVQAPQPAVGLHCMKCDRYDQIRQPEEGTAIPERCSKCGGPLIQDESEAVLPVAGPDGAPQIEPVQEWRVGVSIGNPLYALPRPGSKSMKDCTDLLWAERMPIGEIWYRWKFEAEPDSEYVDNFNVTFEHALNYWYQGFSTVSSAAKDSCLVLRAFCPPRRVKDFPEGFYAIVINGKLVKAEAWPFTEHPLTKASYQPLPTIFFPRSIAFDVAEIQRELNSYESLIKLHGMTSAVDPIVAHEDSLVSEITGRADKVIYWRSGMPNVKEPHRMEHGNLDEGIYKQRDALEAKMRTISMAVNAFRGQQEGAITAASAIQQLRSQAEQMFNKPVSAWNGFWKETVRKGVKAYQRRYTLKQLTDILGEERASEIQLFMGADLDKEVEFVSTSHGLPRTRDEKRQEFMALWDKKALDIQDPAVRQRLFELFGETGMLHTFNQDATNARMENAALQRGEQVVVMPEIEDLQVHLYNHLDKAKSQDFGRWPEPAKTALITHIMETRAAIKQQAMAAMMPQPPPGQEAGAPQPGEPPPGMPMPSPAPPQEGALQ